MSNIIQAIYNIYKCPVYNTGKYYHAKNRANNMGEALEHFIKDSFANSYGFDEADAMKAHSETFAYLGNQNNPPDAILRGGDAIEVKKIESFNSALALNSSYPKSKLYRDSTMITTACKNCDGGTWKEKDLIFAVGVVKNDNIKQLCFVYGEDYAAGRDIYERIRTQIKNGVLEIPDIEFAETNELGRVNHVDPLGITYLRLRGMWHIENPFRVFKYAYKFNATKDFNFLAIIGVEKYESFPQEDRKKIESEQGININYKTIKDPNNPAIMKNVVVITFAR
ncbi:MAG: NgoPII family restriction endonuclease [Clostridiales bacterium]|nr:NgoPII family restriction endonuclease [Clostridiales bacterium]